MVKKATPSSEPESLPPDQVPIELLSAAAVREAKEDEHPEEQPARNPVGEENEKGEEVEEIAEDDDFQTLDVVSDDGQQRQGTRVPKSPERHDSGQRQLTKAKISRAFTAIRDQALKLETYDIPFVYYAWRNDQLEMGSTSVVKNVLESKAGQAFERAFQEVAAAPGTGEEAKDVQEIDLDKILLAMEMDHVKKTVRNWNLYYHSKNKEFEASDQNRPTPKIEGRKAHGMEVWQRQFLKEVVLNYSKNEKGEGEEDNEQEVRASLAQLYQALESKTRKTSNITFDKSKLPHQQHLALMKDLVKTAFSYRFPGHQLEPPKAREATSTLRARSQPTAAAPLPTLEDVRRIVQDELRKTTPLSISTKRGHHALLDESPIKKARTTTKGKAPAPSEDAESSSEEEEEQWEAGEDESGDDELPEDRLGEAGPSTATRKRSLHGTWCSVKGCKKTPRAEPHPTGGQLCPSHWFCEFPSCRQTSKLKERDDGVFCADHFKVQVAPPQQSSTFPKDSAEVLTEEGLLSYFRATPANPSAEKGDTNDPYFWCNIKGCPNNWRSSAMTCCKLSLCDEHKAKHGRQCPLEGFKAGDRLEEWFKANQ